LSGRFFCFETNCVFWKIVQLSKGESKMSERETGTVKWFDSKKGYGFIARESGGDIFVHHSAIVADGFRDLVEGERVEFTVVQGKKGPAASDVRKV
jgi:CspA family cold shock protein